MSEIEQAEVNTLDDLPDHPYDRAWPGFTREGRQLLREAIEEYHGELPHPTARLSARA